MCLIFELAYLNTIHFENNKSTIELMIVLKSLGQRNTIIIRKVIEIKV